MDHLLAVAQPFTPQGRILDVREYGNGNVNDTFLVTVAAAGRARTLSCSASTPRSFAGRNWSWQNLRTVHRPRAPASGADPWSPGRRWEVPRVLPDPGGPGPFH